MEFATELLLRLIFFSYVVIICVCVCVFKMNFQGFPYNFPLPSPSSLGRPLVAIKNTIHSF